MKQEDNQITEDDIKDFEESLKEHKTSGGVLSVNGSVNGTRKDVGNKKLSLSKPDAILELKECTYKTAPKQIKYLLEQLFIDCESEEGHWLFIAQKYTPKTINSVVNEMTKRHRRGEITIKNPAAYFTYLIKFRKKRKKFRNTSGTRKQQENENS
jgi:hypothetical protein